MPFSFRRQRNETDQQQQQQQNNHLHQEHNDVNTSRMLEDSVSENDERIDVTTVQAPSSDPPTRPLPFTFDSSTFWSIYSISVCAFLGAVLRAYLTKYLQCGSSQPSTSFCVTSAQSALFVDLPANWLGSFFMGILWQSQQRFHLHDTIPFSSAWQVGFCGSLTTFSSWNMQMVILLEQNEVATAVLGYILGTLGAYGSFVLGTAFSTITSRNTSERQNDSDDSNGSDESTGHPNTTRTRKPTYPPEVWLIPPTLLTCGLLFFFLTNDTTFSSSLAPLVWTAPAGALTRYYLSLRYNNSSSTITSTTTRIPVRGTLIANWTACMLLALLTGLHVKKSIFPLTTGFLGSLSTVSTWIKEIHCNKAPSNWIYAALTLGGAMLLSLAIYVPLHRFV